MRPNGEIVLQAYTGKKKEEACVLIRGFLDEMGKVSRQSMVFFIGTVFTMFGGYLFKIYTARILGARGLGLYALGVSTVSLFTFLAGLGLPRSMVRFVPAYIAKGQLSKLRTLIWRGTLIVGGTSLVLGGLVVLARNFIAVRIFQSPDLGSVLLLLAITVPLGSVGFLFQQIIAGFEKTARAKSISSFFTFPLMVVLTVVFFSLGWGLQGYIMAILLSSGAGLILLAIVAWRLFPMEVRTFGFTGESFDRAVLSYAGSMMGLGVLSILSGQADKVILGFHLSPASVGIYSVALTAAGFIPIGLNSVNSIFAPVIASLHAGDQHDILLQLFQIVTKWTLGLTLPLFGVVALFAPEFMRVFGSDFRTGWPVLVIVAVGQLVNVGVGSVGYMLMMSGHERLVVKTQAVSSAITVGLYLILIPMLGLIGAAIAVAMGLIISNLLNLRYVQRIIGIWPYNRGFLRLIFPALLMIGVLLLFRKLSSVFVSEVAIILIAFVLAYGVFLLSVLAVGLDKEDRVLLVAFCQSISRAVRNGTRGDA